MHLVIWSCCTHMTTWFQRWLCTAAVAAEESSMLMPEWLVEVLVKEVCMVALEADRSSAAPEEDVLC